MLVQKTLLGYKTKGVQEMQQELFLLKEEAKVSKRKSYEAL